MELLTGPRLARALRAGAIQVARRQAHLDAINVFPVPDADTGTNLAATLRATASSVQTSVGEAVGTVAANAAAAALDGARGNSGVIFAQFLNGLAEAVTDRVTLTTYEFAAAVRRGAEAAQTALHPPREGTILSVLRAWAAAAEEQAPSAGDFRDLFQRALQRARSALADTPKQLEVLRKHNVVDAGGQGFVDFLDGIAKLFGNRRAADWRSAGFAAHAVMPAHAHDEDHLTRYRFCSEALLSGSLDPERLTKAVSGLGDSLVVAHGADRVRVHLHTNHPRTMFETLGAMGTLERTKIDDMVLAQTNAPGGRVALVTDSSCDLPDRRRNALPVFSVPLRVGFGVDGYLDGYDLVPAQFHQLLTSRRELPTTSQPAPSAFRRVYESLLERYDSVLSLHLPGRHSGTYQTALATARQIDARRIRVVDVGHISVALGLVAEAAGEAIARGAELDEATAIAKRAARDTAVWVLLPSLDHVVRGGRVPPKVGRLAKLSRLRLILAFDDERAIRPVGAAVRLRSAFAAVARRARKFAGRDTEIRALVAHAAASEHADQLARVATQRLGLESVEKLSVGPALGVHAGPGAVGLAVRRVVA